MKLSDYVIDFLALRGVKHVFMLSGGASMHLNNSLGKHPDVKYVCNLHEQACAVAAEAYARVTNSLGVVMVTAGPGGTNTITGLAAAWLDSTPVLFLSGQVKRSDLKRDSGVRQLGVQEIDIISLVFPITKYAVTVMDPESIRFHLEKALYLAKSGRPGPVWLDIPLDVQGAQIDPDKLSSFDTESAEILPAFNQDDGSIPNIMELFNQSERPVILVGNGVRIAGAENLFRDLVKLLNIPVLTTRLGVDLLPSSHSLCFGMPGLIASRAANFTLQNSDLLLILGARLDMAMIAYAPDKLAREAKKIMVNNDPHEINKFKGLIDLPVCTDIKDFLKTLLTQTRGIEAKNRNPWLARCRDWKTKYPFVTAEQLGEVAGINTYMFSHVMGDLLVENDIILPGSSGVACEIFLTAFRVKEGQRVFHNKGTGAMGFSQPSGIGACLAANRQRIICVDGDGGFMMNIQELETVKRLDLPIKFFVMNNGGYASIRMSQQTYFGSLTAADETSNMTLPDIGNIVRAFGLPAVKMENPLTLRKELEIFLNAPGPGVCEVMVIRDEPRIPRVVSTKRPDGSMVSKPLEDLYPFLDRAEFLENMVVSTIEE